jgi:GMP synthase (glutamine-hydrolysing)
MPPIPTPSSSSISAPGHPADRPARARGRRLFRDRALPVGRGGLSAHQAEGRDPFGRPGLDHEIGSPRAPQIIFEAGVPVLGICYGQQTMCASSAARWKAATTANSAAPSSSRKPTARSSKGVWAGRAPPGLDEPWRPRHRAARGLRGARPVSEGAPFAAIADERAAFYGVQFHPRSCTRPTAPGCCQFRAQDRRLAGDWTMAPSASEAIARSASRSARAVICGCRAASIPRSPRC